MKLYEKLPDRVRARGRTYKLNLDFRNVLQYMEMLARDDLLPDAREYLALRKLTKHPPRQLSKLTDAVKGLLFPETKRPASHEKLTDFAQDADLIRAAFRQSYGIDLYRDKVHWLEFSSLLNALPEGSRYAEVLGIRARSVPAPTKYNKAERDWLIKAKAQCALEKSDKEITDAYTAGVLSAFRGMMSMVKGGDNSDG